MATSKKSTGRKLSDPMSSVEATPVSLSVRQANGEVKKIRVTYGRGSERPLASYDPDTQSWKMYEDTFLLEEQPSLANLPPSGMTQNGELFLQPAWVQITGGTGLSLLHTPTATMNQMSPSMKSGWWPTPTAVTRPMEGNVRLYRAKVETGEMTEEEAEAILGKSVWEAQGKIPAMWPTPTVDDSKNVNPKPNRIAGLVSAVNKWPTPLATGGGGSGHWNKVEKLFTEGQITYEEKMALQAGRGGKLNPMWVEWLMGFPIGWTDLED